MFVLKVEIIAPSIQKINAKIAKLQLNLKNGNVKGEEKNILECIKWNCERQNEKRDGQNESNGQV